MPALEAPFLGVSGSDPAPADAENTTPAPTGLPFPPVTKSHILACSYTSWYPTFRPHTPKARIIPLPNAFLDYLRSDGIVLPPSRPGTPPPPTTANTTPADDEGFFSSSELSTASTSSDDTDVPSDPSVLWSETHTAIKSTIHELGGAVIPKLNWSAPKDAAWISTTNTLECRSANDIYLLLKSSDFITHDLDHAFDGCVDDSTKPEIEYALILRKSFRLNPSLEFRVFVRDNVVLGATQRDLNHYDFLFGLRPKIKSTVLRFWEEEVRGKFNQRNYTMDVYLPPPHDRVWIVDFNPWAPRTDPGLWSWMELLSMPEPGPSADDNQGEEVVRLRLGSGNQMHDDDDSIDPSEDDGIDDSDDEVEQTISSKNDPSPGPEFRLVTRDDPEAYMFNSTRYSAHKLPRDVVDASQAGAGGMREFADRWREMLAVSERGRAGVAEDSSDDDNE